MSHAKLHVLAAHVGMALGTVVLQPASQPPQLAVLVVVSTQVPPQTVGVPAGQLGTQVDDTQSGVPVGHALSHAEQCSGSLVRSTHVPPQLVVPPSQLGPTGPASMASELASSASSDPPSSGAPSLASSPASGDVLSSLLSLASSLEGGGDDVASGVPRPPPPLDDPLPPVGVSNSFPLLPFPFEHAAQAVARTSAPANRSPSEDDEDVMFARDHTARCSHNRLLHSPLAPIWMEM